MNDRRSQAEIGAAIRARIASEEDDPDTAYLPTYWGAIKALLDMCDDEDQRPGGQRLGTESVREEIAAAFGLLDAGAT